MPTKMTDANEPANAAPHYLPTPEEIAAAAERIKQQNISAMVASDATTHFGRYVTLRTVQCDRRRNGEVAYHV